VKYFKPEELVGKKTFETMGENSLSLFSPQALIALDNLREYFNCPITVNNWHKGGMFQWRGYRTPEKAKELGSPNSQHAKGNAFDCTINGYSAREVRAEIIAHQDHELLKLITRMEANTSWLHFDLMELPKNKQRIYLFRA
jgi:hypothetical protein